MYDFLIFQLKINLLSPCSDLLMDNENHTVFLVMSKVDSQTQILSTQPGSFFHQDFNRQVFN